MATVPMYEEPPRKTDKEKAMNANTILVLNQILKDGLKMLGDSAEAKGMLGEDVIDHRSAEYLAKSWGLDWINKTPEEVEAEENAAAEEEDNQEGGKDESDDEEEDDEAEIFGHRTGFREPNFEFEYGFNPLVALGEFIRMRHPRVRLRRVVSATRAFCLNRSPGVRAITFTSNQTCSVEATSLAATESLELAKTRLETEKSTNENNPESIALAQAAVAVAEAVCTLANQSANGHAAGHAASDKEVTKMLDPRLGTQGKKQAESIAAELKEKFSNGENPLHKKLCAGLEVRRRMYLSKRGLLEHGPFDLVISAPLTSCMETAHIISSNLGGKPPKLIVAPVITSSAVASKNETDPKEKKDALLPSRKGRSIGELKNDFSTFHYHATPAAPLPSSRPSSSSSSSSSSTTTPTAGASRKKASSNNISFRNSESLLENQRVSIKETDVLKKKKKEQDDEEEEQQKSKELVNNACLDWDLSELEDVKHWKCSHHESHKPGWFHPTRLNGHRCDEAIDWMTNRVEKHILVVGQTNALVKILGVPSNLLTSTNSTNSTSTNSNAAGTASSSSKGIVRRLIGSEYTWTIPCFILGGRKGETPLIRSLMTELLPRLSDLDKYRGYVGFAIHFEHAEGEVLVPGHDEYDDAPINIQPQKHSRNNNDAGYENFGRTYEVKGTLHITWANEGFADECNRYDEIKKLCDQIIALASASCQPNPAAVSSAIAKFQSGETPSASLNSSMYKIDKYPPSLPGQGPSLLSLPNEKSSTIGKAATYIRLQFRTNTHGVQGRKAYREKVVESASNEPGFVQSWLEMEQKGLNTRVTILWSSAQSRDQAFGVVNEQFASVLAPFAIPGTLVISRGRAIVPNTLPDPTDRGLDIPDDLY